MYSYLKKNVKNRFDLFKKNDFQNILGGKPDDITVVLATVAI